MPRATKKKIIISVRTEVLAKVDAALEAEPDGRPINPRRSDLIDTLLDEYTKRPGPADAIRRARALAKSSGPKRSHVPPGEILNYIRNRREVAVLDMLFALNGNVNAANIDVANEALRRNNFTMVTGGEWVRRDA